MTISKAPKGVRCPRPIFNSDLGPDFFKSYFSVAALSVVKPNRVRCQFPFQKDLGS